MRIRDFAAATAAVSLAVAPAMAQAADRTSAPAEEKSELGGTGIILALLAAAAVIGGIIIAADGGDDDPVSV